MPSAAHEKLCKRLMFPASGRLARIWELLVDDTDAALLMAMPGTIAQLAGAAGMPEREAAERIAELFHRGVAFESQKPAGPIFRSPRHVIQLHDASVQWPEAPEALLDLWKEFMHEEYPAFLSMAVQVGMAPFIRAVPTIQAAGTLADLDPSEDVAAMVDQAEDLAVCRCPCRLEERACDSPVERCLQMNRGARYAIKRGVGRAITRAEALDILVRMADQGLVHLVESREGLGNVICNCCSCCCAIIRPAREHASCRPILAPSSYVARVETDDCTADGLCAESCPMEAIRIGGSEEAAALVDPELCIGCGVCLSVCPTAAISLVPRATMER